METYQLIVILPPSIFLLAAIWNYKQRKKHIEKIEKMSIDQKKLEIAKLQSRLGEYKTSHLLHFLLSFLFLGLWVFPWLLVTISNSRQRASIHKIIESA